VRKSKFTEEQIIKVLREVDAGAQGPGRRPPPRDHRDDLLPVEVEVRRPRGQRCEAAPRARRREPEAEDARCGPHAATSRPCSTFSEKNGRAGPASASKKSSGVRDEEAADLPRRRSRAGDLLLPRASPGAGRGPGEAQGVRRRAAALGLPAPPRPAEARGARSEPQARLLPVPLGRPGGQAKETQAHRRVGPGSPAATDAAARLLTGKPGVGKICLLRAPCARLPQAGFAGSTIATPSPSAAATSTAAPVPSEAVALSRQCGASPSTSPRI